MSFSPRCQLPHSSLLQYHGLGGDDGDTAAAAAAREAADETRSAVADVRKALSGTGEGPRAAASTDGEIAADVNDGAEFSVFSLHHTSVGISFGAVALFLLSLAVAYLCFRSACCGIFNCCLVCKPRQHQSSPGREAAAFLPAQPPPYPAIAYDPYECLQPPHAPSRSSTVYGLQFGPAPPLPPPRNGRGRGTRPLPAVTFTRDRSPSAVSRIFLSARKEAASSSNTGRISDVTDDDHN